MKRLAILCLLAALPACGGPTPCDDVPGTCLTVRLLSAASLGERLDSVRFSVEADGGVRHEHTWTALRGGQLLPVEASLPLPDEVQGTATIAASGLWNGDALINGTRVVAGLSPGDRRAIAMTLMNPSSPGQCQDGVRDGAETGVDCGGGCAPCAPTCSDATRNGDESDVDCGGSCTACYGGQACGAPTDCLSGRCEGTRCVAALSLASLSPSGGPATGGGEVTLFGELMTTGMEVRFGQTLARLLRVAGDGRSAAVEAPVGSAGPVDVSLREGAQSATRPRAYAYHYGRITMTGLPPVGLGGKPYFLLSGHFNGAIDMVPDIAVVNEFDCDVSLLLGGGDGTFMKSGAYTVGRTPGTYPLMAAAGDLNGDGVPDFVTADNRQPTVSVVLCKGDGTCQPSVTYDLPAGAKQPFAPAATAADFNGDGLDDLATMDGINGGRLVVYLAEADRSGALGPAQIIPGGALGVPESDVTITSGRLDGDSQPDIVVANAERRTAKVFLGNGDGSFRIAGEFPLGGVKTFVLTVADFNHDGKPDVLSANRGSDDVSVLLGKGDGTFHPARVEPACLGPYQIRTGDLDGDGRLDIAVPCFREERSGKNVLMLLFGDGRGGVDRKLEVPVLATSYAVTIADWNGDGKLDLATVSVAPSNSLSVFLNQSQ